MIDYKAWALDLSSLLDEIEAHEEDADKVAELLAYRFEIARSRGFQVVIEGPVEIGHA